MIEAVFEPETPANNQPLALRERFERLAKQQIDFIPNPNFRLSDLKDFSISSPHQAGIAESSPNTGSKVDLPPHLQRLCETELLSAEQEAALFREMNFLKFCAAELRAELLSNRPQQAQTELKIDEPAMASIENALAQANAVRDHLIKANMRLVMSIAKKFVTPQQSFDDLLSEGVMTLMQAVEKFDFERGFRFSTYAYRSISRTAYRFVTEAQQEEAKVTRDAEAWAFEQDDSLSPSSLSDNAWSDLRRATAAMLQRLDRRERLIIRSRYALGSHRRVRSFQDLANRLGVSKERVRQLEARAVAKMQKMAADLDMDELGSSLLPV